MDREFMIDFYENYYDDALYAALEGDKDYEKDHRDLIQAEAELLQLIGGSKTPVGEKLKECVGLAINISGYIGLDSYLQGAADREKMIR
ncbi:MAG: hypothetical protein LUE90_09745 [Clostridiales bacterium]|nr:hypothetical protein [Clostridiales bacterium]